jgi:monoterpene epsilon-lactone hydrolase
VPVPRPGVRSRREAKESPLASQPYEALMAAFGQPLVGSGDSTEVARNKLNAVHGHAVAADVRVEWTQLGGVPCAWIDTPESDAAPEPRVLLLCHGGAYIAAGGDGYLFYGAVYSRACSARILLVDYRLAPEHRCPIASQDCATAYRALLALGVTPESVAFIGDSCGGGLALASLIELKAAGVALPACAITLGGWFDLAAGSESAEHPLGPDPFANADFVRARGRDYVGPDGDLRDPAASVLYAPLRGLPPLLLQVGQVDLTRDEAFELAARAGRAGVDVTLEVYPEMVHGFQGLAHAGIPEAVASVERVARFVDARVPAPR